MDPGFFRGHVSGHGGGGVYYHRRPKVHIFTGGGGHFLTSGRENPRLPPGPEMGLPVIRVIPKPYITPVSIMCEHIRDDGSSSDDSPDSPPPSSRMPSAPRPRYPYDRDPPERTPLVSIKYDSAPAPPSKVILCQPPQSYRSDDDSWSHGSPDSPPSSKPRRRPAPPSRYPYDGDSSAPDKAYNGNGYENRRVGQDPGYGDYTNQNGGSGYNPQVGGGNKIDGGGTINMGPNLNGGNINSQPTLIQEGPARQPVHSYPHGARNNGAAIFRKLNRKKESRMEEENEETHGY